MSTAPLPAAPPWPRRRGLWLLIAVVTALFVVLPGLLAAAMFITRHAQYRTAIYHHPLAVLRVSAPGAEITVSAGPPGPVQVMTGLTRDLGHPAPQVRQSWAGRTLTVTADACASKPLTRCNVQLSVVVPAGATVRADAGDGSVNLTGLTGPVHARVTFGAISMLRLAGPVWAATADGSISGIGLTSPQVRAAAGRGSLSLQFTAPPRRLTATASAGNVSVTVPRGSRYRLVAAVPAGSLSVPPALVSGSSPWVITLSGGDGSVFGLGYGPAFQPPQRPQPSAPRQPASSQPAPPPARSAGP